MKIGDEVYIHGYVDEIRNDVIIVQNEGGYFGTVEKEAKELIRCRDCKHFELNHYDNVNGIPLITAHEICTRWGDGCKTSSEGYCFMGEKK